MVLWKMRIDWFKEVVQHTERRTAKEKPTQFTEDTKNRVGLVNKLTKNKSWKEQNQGTHC